MFLSTYGSVRVGRAGVMQQSVSLFCVHVGRQCALNFPQLTLFKGMRDDGLNSQLT